MSIDGGESPLLVGITESSSTLSERGRLVKWVLQAEAARLLPSHKVGMCCKMIAKGKADVPVLFNTDTKRARFGNLCTCAKLWVCPVCASRITEKRALAIGAGLRRSGVFPVLVTFTMAHHTGERLEGTLAALTNAYAGLTSGRAWAGFMAVTGWITAIRALEVTYGQNGWHPHLHILAFFDRAQHADDVSLLEMSLADRWQKHLAKQGATASKAHGVDVRAAFGDVAEYVAKYGREKTREWTIERELTKAPVKVARAGGFTPFALLDASSQGTAWAGERFIEYSKAMVNKAQLYIPPNARELLGLDADDTDEKLADDSEQTDVERVLARLSRDQWSVILQRDMRLALLDVASAGDTDVLERWIVDNVG